MFSSNDRKSAIKNAGSNHEKHIEQLSRDSLYETHGLKIYAPAGTYHPSKNSSSEFLLDTISQLVIKNSKIVEIGCGTGVISIYLAKNNNMVTSTDISNICCAATCWNAKVNNCYLDIRIGDMWSPIMPEETYDISIFNPPLMDKNPDTEEELSLCDPGGKIIKSYFSGVKSHLRKNGKVITVYSNISAELPSEWSDRYRVLSEQKRPSGTIFQVLEFSI